MDERPLFSIIVPVYNAIAFVGDTIHNLLRQDVNKEILLINDGSTDDSLQLIKQYESKYDCIKVVDKKNGGVSSARNVGLNVAKGDYVIFVDSDDFIDDGLLERCEIILQGKSTDAVIFSYKYVYPKSSRKDICFRYKSSDYYSLKEWLNEFYQLWSCHILHCIGTKVYRKSVIDQYNIRFNESISYLEDISFALEYLSHISNIYYLDEPAYHYRIINENSLITKYRTKYVEATDYLNTKLETLWSYHYSEHSQNINDYYRVVGSNILGCIENLVSHRKESADVIDKDFAELANLPYLDRCIRNAGSIDGYVKLFILQNGAGSFAKWLFTVNYNFRRLKWQLKHILKQRICPIMR